VDANMTMTQTETLGFGKNMIELLDKETATLEKAGIHAKEIRATMAVKVERAAQANAHQEELKRQSKQATEEVTALMDDLYRTASGYLDAAIAAVGKGSEAAKNFQRLRSRARMPDQGGETVPEVPPSPA
jgi:hypothetical protein